MEKQGMQVWLALEIKDKVKQVSMELIDDVLIQFQGYLAGVAGKFPQSGRALRAAKVARSGRLDRDGERVAAMTDDSPITAGIVAQIYPGNIGNPTQVQFAQ